MTDQTSRQGRKLKRNPVGANRNPALAALLCAGMLAIPMVAGCAAAPDAPAAGGLNVNAQSANTAPAVVEVAASPERLQPGDICQLTCQATDADGDALTYTWMASQGEIVGMGTAVEWHAPDAEGLFRMSVAVDDGRGGTDEHSVSLAVKSNSTPEFQSLPSFDQGVRPGASVTISCPAVDADGDAVTYKWHAAFGELSGEGATVTWVAPKDLGSYVVTVSASDSYGGESRRDVLISVTPSLTPRLGTFSVEAVDHDMLKYELGVWDIYIGESCRIECVVAEGDGPFTYNWTVDEGILTADGAVATWQAPEVRGPATIKVDVTDSQGNTNSGQLLIYAEDCTCAFN